MRIAYVTIHVAPEIMQGGVGKKIRTQMDIWRRVGHEVVLFSLTPAEIPFPTEKRFIFEKGANLVKREFNRAAMLRHLMAAVSAYRPDIIYLRFGLYSYPLHRLFKLAPVVVEVNSNDLVEYRERGRGFYWMNRLTRRLILAPAAGLIYPTHELERLFRTSFQSHSCVIPNGLDLRSVQPLPAVQHASPEITLVGSPGMSWHGVDKLITLAKQFPELRINIVGYSPGDMNAPIPGNVHLHGFLSGNALKEVLAETDVVCGTLALHRKSMQEACPLKVREALAYGIPLILAYKDTDLENVAHETILRIPNTEDNVAGNALRIREFAYAMIGRRVPTEEIWPVLDQEKKEMNRLQFFRKILDDQGER